MDWTTPINQYFAEDYSRRDILVIVDGAAIDFLVIVQGLRLLVRGTTFRFFIANLLFYGMRALIQYLSILQFPKGYIWDYPGIPSLFI